MSMKEEAVMSGVEIIISYCRDFTRACTHRTRVVARPAMAAMGGVRHECR
jgi:hypothetical protein